MRRIDVSMPLFAGMPAFPGDPEFVVRPVRSVSEGDPYSLSALSLGSHAGTHVDPPSHFLAGGDPVDRLDLSVLNGPCRVVDIPPERSVIGPEEVSSVPSGTSRVLFRTANSLRWREKLEFFPGYVAVSERGAQALLDRGVRLVGIDSLSVESDVTDRFPVHHRLLGGGALILEGLLLAESAAGAYELECLPLRIRGGDGGPARAALRVP
jgi:arylformamidase